MKKKAPKKFPRTEVIGRQLTEYEASLVVGGATADPNATTGKGSPFWPSPVIIPLYGVVVDAPLG